MTTMVKLKRISDMDMSLEIFKVLYESKDPSGMTDSDLFQEVEKRLNVRGLTAREEEEEE
jgi:hypothetical protein